MKMFLRIFCLLVSTSFFFQTVGGFGFGAPHSSCGNNVPHHHNEASWSPCPYKITVDQLSYNPGDVITVNITSDMLLPFRGFQIRANRVSGNIHEIVGEFIQIPDDCKKQIWYSATNESNCVTHKANNAKISVVLTWRAPASSIGDIVFSAGIVKNFDMFWVDVKSPVLRAVQAAPVEHVETVGELNPEFSTSGCGSSKGCIMWPSTCSGDACRYVVTYNTVENGKFVDIEMAGETDGYISIGLSYDLLMGHDETYLCGSTSDYSGIQHGYNPTYYNTIHMLGGMTHMQMRREGHMLYCRFRRPIKTVIENPDGYVWPPRYVNTSYFDMNDEFYLQIAVGTLYLGTPSAHKHDVLPLVTKEKVNFQSKTVVRAQLMHVYLQAHVILSLTSWLLLVGFLKAVTVVRHGSLANKCCKLAIWFQIHRAVAVISALCTIAAVVVIFVYLKKFTLYAFIHAVLGLVVTGLVLVQIMAGLLRPNKEHKSRAAWQFLHYVAGNFTHVLAAVTLLLGVQTSIFDKHFQHYMTIVIGCWMAVQVVFDFIFAKVRSNALQEELSEKEKVTEAYKMNQMEQERPDPVPGRGSSVLVAAYAFIQLAFYAASIYYVGSW